MVLVISPNRSEPASQAFVEATAAPPDSYDLTPDEARKVLDEVQSAPIDRASDTQFAGLPPALLIVDGADLLRDEGEAHAGCLRQAGVAITTVRYAGARRGCSGHRHRGQALHTC